MLAPVLHDFLERLDREQIAERMAQTADTTATEARRRLDVYLNEAYVGLDLVESHLAAPRRILEVGAGVGVLSAFLAELGHDVTAIEPSGPGFETMDAARIAIDTQLGGTARSFLDVGIEALPETVGDFDLVFSVHVLEHVADPEAAIAGMHRHLAEGGRSVHVCPNYAFPFDPHFGIPLVPAAPSLTTRFLPARIRESGVWQSLNFVTAGRIRRIARRQGLQPVFRDGVMVEMVDRLERDPIFRLRHERLVRLVDVAVDRLQLRRLLERWPAGLASPMVFELERTQR